jgi:carotenoid cleavage dioxygenase-like enzyme
MDHVMTQIEHPTPGGGRAETPFFERGNYRPLFDELSADDLPVSGAIPPELNGWYLRNGPNPMPPARQWFMGEGMIHGVRLENGRAAWYRNRWVRTRNFLAGGGSVYGPHGERDLTFAAANTHVVTHAGRTLALVETSLPYEIDMELNTVGLYDFGGRLANSMTAHPKICPTTGELHFFGYGSQTAPYVTYHRANAAGELVVQQAVDVPGLTMMHDFHLTSRHVVFMDLPVIFDRAMAGQGRLPYRWDDGYGARLGVMRRDDPTAPVRWFEINPCYVFHSVNAHDEDGRIVLHVVRYPHFWRGEEQSSASLWRWVIDLKTGQVLENQLDDRPCEFPRIDDRLAGLPVRHPHVTDASASTGGPGSIIRYDLDAGSANVHVFGAGRTPGEAVFVPTDHEPGSHGWLLTYVYDAATDRSELVILDTSHLEGDPVAVISLPTRVPYGFHGNWMPDNTSTRSESSES